MLGSLPDIYMERSRMLMSLLKRVIEDTDKKIKQNKRSYGRLINDRHTRRMYHVEGEREYALEVIMFCC